MTSITQINAFKDQELRDLEKLRLLFDRLSDEELSDAVDYERAEGGSRDWSNRSLWYCY